MPTAISIEKHTIGPKDRGFVVPPITDIGTTVNDTVTWTNKTGDKVRLWFPNGDLLFQLPTPSGVGTFSDPITILPSPPASNSFTVKLRGGAAYGYYKYSVYCEGLIGDHAQGNSEPGLHVP